MSTFLEICQSVAADSGTISSSTLTQPATTTGQTGRLLRIVNWTREAYRQIQVMRDDWRWLRAEFDGQTTIGIRRYTLNESSERFKKWIFEDEKGNDTFSAYLQSDGQAEEYYLRYMPWSDFRRIYLFGSNAAETGKPSIITVDPQNQLTLFPIPDAVYTLRGEFERGPQILAADAELPEMPEEYHEAIKWKALILMGIFDEAVEQKAAWEEQFAYLLDDMVRTQTPRITLGGPLA